MTDRHHKGVDSHDLEITSLTVLYPEDLSARDLAIDQRRLYDLNVSCLGILNQMAG